MTGVWDNFHAALEARGFVQFGVATNDIIEGVSCYRYESKEAEVLVRAARHEHGFLVGIYVFEREYEFGQKNILDAAIRTARQGSGVYFIDEHDHQFFGKLLDALHWEGKDHQVSSEPAVVS